MPSTYFDLVDSDDQQILIETIGDDVMLIEENNSKGTVNLDDVMPDWCALVVRAVNWGMMSGAHAPWTSKGSITQRAFDPAKRQANWSLSLKQIDSGVFLVLINILRARVLDAFSLRTLERPVGGMPFPIEILKYPRRYEDIPFLIDAKPPLRTSKDRSISVVFAQPPDHEFRRAAMDAVKTWSNLLVLAAYTPPGKDPQRSYTLPEFPYWFDPVTLSQPFLEFFDADDACFDAMVNWAVCIHHVGHTVDRLIIR